MENYLCYHLLTSQGTKEDDSMSKKFISLMLAVLILMTSTAAFAIPKTIYVNPTGSYDHMLYKGMRDDTDEVEFPDECSVDSLKSLEFLREHKNIIMYGGTGTGKTMLSICIGMIACKRDIPVRFFRTASLVNTLSSRMKAGKLDSFRDKLSKASILILDEFGYVPYDRDGINILFDFLSEISDDPTKVVILNTNLEFSRWVNVLYDQKMTAALIGRLTHHCHLILFPGENNRLKESSINMIYRSIADRQERMQR